MPYPTPKNTTDNFFLQGDLRMAQITLVIFGCLPFVFMCALTTFRVDLGAKLVLILMANLGFFIGLAFLLGLVRHKETNRPVINRIVSILGMLLSWGYTAYMIYMFIALLGK